jgi:hypothetical protein
MSGLQTNAATVGLFVPGNVRAASLNATSLNGVVLSAGFGTVVSDALSNSAFVVAVPGMTATGKAIAYVSGLDTTANIFVESSVAGAGGEFLGTGAVKVGDYVMSKVGFPVMAAILGPRDMKVLKRYIANSESIHANTLIQDMEGRATLENIVDMSHHVVAKMRKLGELHVPTNG